MLPDSNPLDDVKLEDIPPRSTTIQIPDEAARSFGDTICKRCSDLRAEHTAVPLPNGSRCKGKEGNCNCSGFVEWWKMNCFTKYSKTESRLDYVVSSLNGFGQYCSISWTIRYKALI